MSTGTTSEYKTKRSTVSPITRAMMDILCDGKSHWRKDIVAAGATAALATEYNRCLAEGAKYFDTKSNYLGRVAWSGALRIASNNLMIAERRKRVSMPGKRTNRRVKMDAQYAAEWAHDLRLDSGLRQKEKPAVQVTGEVTKYAGIDEWEGWAYAPLVTQDVAHVRPAMDLNMDRLRAAFPGWTISVAPDGLVSIGAHPGAPVKRVVTDWFDREGLYHEGVRHATNVRRRNLRDLPPAFLSDVVVRSVPFAAGLINSRYSASMRKLVPDTDEADGQIQMWVIELISSFNAELGCPFGTWLTNQIPRKIQDLNRASSGRTAADAEMRHSRARAQFEATNGRAPTTSELAEILNLTPEEMAVKRRHLANLTGIRSTIALETGPDAPEIPLPDMGPSPESEAEDREQSQQITLALLAACGKYDSNLGRPVMTRPRGFLVTYLMNWGSWVKGDLIQLSGCADRRVSDEVEAVQTDLAKSLAGMR